METYYFKLEKFPTRFGESLYKYIININFVCSKNLSKLFMYIYNQKQQYNIQQVQYLNIRIVIFRKIFSRCSSLFIHVYRTLIVYYMILHYGPIGSYNKCLQFFRQFIPTTFVHEYHFSLSFIPKQNRYSIRYFYTERMEPLV